MPLETDGYHPQFVHGSIFSVTGSPIAGLYSDKSTAVTRNLGNGHSENDLRPEFRRIAEPMRWFGTTQARVPGYVSRMREVYGDAAEQILIEGPRRYQVTDVTPGVRRPRRSGLEEVRMTGLQVTGAALAEIGLAIAAQRTLTAVVILVEAL